jgi:hypothetical protein
VESPFELVAHLNKTDSEKFWGVPVDSDSSSHQPLK